MKKIIRLTENDLVRLVNRVLVEGGIKYGSDEIRRLYDKLSDTDDVYLDDSSGDLSGQVVSKKEYLTRMLNKAIADENWNLVSQAISYLMVKF